MILSSRGGENVALMMKTATTSEISANFYQSTSRNNSEGNHFRIYENLFTPSNKDSGS
jgi:hypothetical protein